jgi:hypothetical protein
MLYVNMLKICKDNVVMIKYNLMEDDFWINLF